MVQSLLGNTRGIASRATRSTARKQSRTTGNKNLIVRPLADNTHDAITLGSLAAVAALIDTTVTRITRELGVRPVVFLTGGGADAVAPLLKGACKLRDDLNLRGVAAIAGAHIQRRA
jgi:pantothenate kinase type III